MKNAAYFLLLCGLMNSAVWGESPRKNQPSVVLKCGTLSCTASVSSIDRRANRAVELGTFKSLPHSGIRRVNNEVELGTFPPPYSGIRRAKLEVNVGTFKAYPGKSPLAVLLQVSEVE
jgi:hypothetical protein